MPLDARLSTAPPSHLGGRPLALTPCVRHGGAGTAPVAERLLSPPEVAGSAGGESMSQCLLMSCAELWTQRSGHSMRSSLAGLLGVGAAAAVDDAMGTAAVVEQA